MPLPPLHMVDPGRFDRADVLKRLNGASRALAELKGVAASIPNQNILTPSSTFLPAGTLPWRLMRPSGSRLLPPGADSRPDHSGQGRGFHLLAGPLRCPDNPAAVQPSPEPAMTQAAILEGLSKSKLAVEMTEDQR